MVAPEPPAVQPGNRQANPHGGLDHHPSELRAPAPGVIQAGQPNRGGQGQRAGLQQDAEAERQTHRQPAPERETTPHAAAEGVEDGGAGGQGGGGVLDHAGHEEHAAVEGDQAGRQEREGGLGRPQLARQPVGEDHGQGREGDGHQACDVDGQGLALVRPTFGRRVMNVQGLVRHRRVAVAEGDVRVDAHVHLPGVAGLRHPGRDQRAEGVVERRVMGARPARVQALHRQFPV